MTSLEEMLERAARSEPAGFTAEDVRRRVRRRSHARRAGAVVWGAATVTGDPPEQVEVADEGNEGIVGGNAGRWTPIAYSAVTVGAVGAFLEFDDAGTLRGDDGCRTFTGSWAVEDDRLIIGDFEQGPGECDVRSDTMLVEILRDAPMIGPSEFAPGSLELRSERGFVAFERADPHPATATTTTESSDRDESTTTVAPGNVPARWVGQDGDHRLVVVDTASGDVVRVLETFDDPDTFTEETGEPYAGGSFLGAIAVSPDGRTVYWERCCEPAPGVIFPGAHRRGGTRAGHLRRLPGAQP